jgi:hypothetical protein
MSPSNRVAQLYPQAPGSLFVSSYDSQDYGADILTRLHAELNKDNGRQIRESSGNIALSKDNHII